MKFYKGTNSKNSLLLAVLLRNRRDLTELMVDRTIGRHNNWKTKPMELKINADKMVERNGGNERKIIDRI